MAMDSKTEEILLKKCCSLKSIKALSEEEVELLLKQADKNDRLQSNNKFLGRTDTVKFFIFNLPRRMTCPGQTKICSEHCYQGVPENMVKEKGRESAVVYARKLNWFLSTRDDFVERMFHEIDKRRPKSGQKIIIRIHASGDFYSEEYLKKWMKIALITKLNGKAYDFVAYTKSFSELDNVLSDQKELQKLYKESHEFAGKELLEKENLTLADFNLHIIASYMDDTAANQKRIAEKWGLPVYFVTKYKTHELVNCGAKENACAECLKCYKFPMDTVYTALR